MSTPTPYGKPNISRGSKIPRTPVPQKQAPSTSSTTRILDHLKSGQKSGGRKRKSSSVDGRSRPEVLREEGGGDKTGGGGSSVLGDTFSIPGPRPKSIAKRKSSSLPATSFFDKDLDKMTDSQIENNYRGNKLVPLQIQRLRSSVGRSSLSSVSSEDSFKPSESQINAEMKKNAIYVPAPPKSTDNSRDGTFTIDGTPLSDSAFENAFKANANIIVPHYNQNNNSNDQSDSSNNSYVPSESKIIEAMKKHGPYVPPMKKSTKRSSSQSDISDGLTDSVYEREFRKNAVLIAPGIKKSTHASETLPISSGDHDQDQDHDHDQDVEKQIESSKKSDDRETEQITFEVEKGTFTKETQPLNVEKEDNLEENQSEDEISTIVETFEKDDISISKKLQRTTRKSFWKESIIDDSSEGLDSTNNKLRASVSKSDENNINIEVSKEKDETIIIEKEQQQQQEKRDLSLVKVSKKKDETIIIEKEKEQEKRDLVKKVPKPRSQSQQSEPEVRITRKNKEVAKDVNNYNDEKTQKINHSTPIKKKPAKKNLNHLNLSAISSQENKDYNSLMSVKRPRFEKKQELLKLRKSNSQTATARPILKNVFEMSFSSENEESENEELTLKDDKNNDKDQDESETSFEDPDHLPSSCSINNDYDSDNKSIDEIEIEKEVEKPKTSNKDLIEKNDKSSKKASNIKKSKLKHDNDDNENEIEKEVEKPKTPNKVKEIPSDLTEKNDKKSSKKASISNIKKSKDNENEKEVEKPKTKNIKEKDKPSVSDSTENNVKKSTMKETKSNVKKPKVILPKKLGKNKEIIDKPTRSLRLRSQQQPDKDQENPKSPLKEPTSSPSSSPQKKKLRTSSIPDVHKNDKSLDIPIKKITRRSSIQPGTSDQPRDPVSEKEIRKNAKSLDIPIKKITRRSSIQPETNDQPRDPVFEKEMRKNDSIITPEIRESTQDHYENEDHDEKSNTLDSNEKNVKKSSTKKEINIKKLKVILPKKVGKINKATTTTDKLRSLRLRSKASAADKVKEISKTPLKDQTPSPSSSPQKKKLRTSSTSDVNKNDKSLDIPIKKITRRSSIQTETSDQLRDPVYEKEIRKNAKSLDVPIKKITRRSSIQAETSDPVYEKEIRKNRGSILAPEIKKSKTLSILSAQDYDYDQDQGQEIDSMPVSATKKKKSDHRETDQITTPGQRSSIRNASLKISSKYKKKFEPKTKNRPLSVSSEPEPGPSSSTLTLNAKNKVVEKIVKKKSGSKKVKKVEYAKLYQLQNRLWGKMNPTDIKRVHRVMNNYIELFLNQLQSNCRNIYGKYTYLELERALAAEGLIPRKKGYLMSYMASIFNVEQMRLVSTNGLYPLRERNISGNNFPE